MSGACSGVSTPGEVSSVRRTWMDAPFSRARSCSSDSACSSGEGGQVTKRSRKLAAVGVDALVAEDGQAGRPGCGKRAAASGRNRARGRRGW